MNLFLLLGAFWAVQGNAAVVDDLYVVKTPIADQTTLLRLDTFKTAFANVLVKISGTDTLLNDPALKSNIRSSSRYVKQFKYEREELDEEAVEESPLVLSVEFEQKLVDDLLRAKGYSVWGKVRPSVLVVMSKRLNKNQQLVSEESAPEVLESIEKLSQKHGLPTQFPLLDLQDMSVLQFSQSALADELAVSELGARYQADVVLTGELTGITGQGWMAKWRSQFSGQVFEWEKKSSTKEDVLAKSMSHMAKILAQEYALGSQQESINRVTVEVNDVTSLDAYLVVSRYFASLAIVEKTQVKTIKENSVAFHLTLRNSPDELQRLIQLSDVIEQVELPVIDTTVGSTIETDGEDVIKETLNLTYRLL